MLGNAERQHENITSSHQHDNESQGLTTAATGSRASEPSTLCAENRHETSQDSESRRGECMLYMCIKGKGDISPSVLTLTKSPPLVLS